MSELRPCPACDRHVKSDESSCPFCAAALEPAPARRLPRGRLTRAAVFASALAGTAACGTSQQSAGDPNDNPPPPAVADAGTDEMGGGGDQAGPPSPPDAGTQPVDDVKEERRVPDHDIPMPYGAPPARSRLV